MDISEQLYTQLQETKMNLVESIKTYKAPYDMIPTTVMTFWKRQNYGEYIKVSDRQWAEKMEVWKGGMNR